MTPPTETHNSYHRITPGSTKYSSTFLRKNICFDASKRSAYSSTEIEPSINLPITKFMRNIDSTLALLLLLSTVCALMGDQLGAGGAGVEVEKKEEATVHIVYVDRPEGTDPEEFHIRTLGSVLGSEEAAKEAVLYHYKHAASGFSAKLTPSQVEEMKKQPGVLQVVPSQTYQLHGAGANAMHRMGV